jgi:hypothetical protein
MIIRFAAIKSVATSFTVLSWAAVAVLTQTAQAANAGADLAAHRAIYKMSLATAKSGSGVTSASGAMSYKFGDSCDGWIVENKTALSFAYSDGAPVSTTWDFVTWESKDGLHYRFRVRSTKDGVVNEEIDGTADLDGKDKGGVAKFTLPEPKTLALPAGTLFPTEHTLRMIELAQHGEHLAERTLFDGTGTDQTFEVSAIIGKAAQAAKSSPMAAPTPNPITRSACAITRTASPTTCCRISALSACAGRWRSSKPSPSPTVNSSSAPGSIRARSSSAAKPPASGRWPWSARERRPGPYWRRVPSS